MPSDIPENPKPGSPPLMDDDAIADVRNQVRAIMANEGLRVTDIARESPVAAQTLNAWVNNNYSGRNDFVAARMMKWLETREARKQIAAVAPDAPNFIMTKTGEDIIALLRHAQHMPDIAAFLGAPGLGKTSAACHYTKVTSNVWKVTANETLKKPRAVLMGICRAMKIPAAGMPETIQWRICERVRGTRGLIIIDEAQHALPEALDLVRSIHDDAGIGIALLGSIAVESRLDGDGRKDQFAQLSSRVGMRRRRTTTKPADVDALLDAWNIEGEAERRLLHAIAKLPGALRLMTKTLKMTHMLAAPDQAPISADLIHAAFSGVSNTPLPRRAEEVA